LFNILESGGHTCEANCASAAGHLRDLKPLGVVNTRTLCETNALQGKERVNLIILRLTQVLLKDMKVTPIESDDLPSLFNWHVNIYKLNNRKHIVFVNDLSRLSIIIDGIRTGQLALLKEKFLVTLWDYLRSEMVEDFLIDSYLKEGSEIKIAKTNSRSVLGTMKEVTFFIEDDFKDNISRLKWLNQLIHKPIDYYEPINVFKQAIKDQYKFIV
jgi:hypothetical protein